ncbi:Chemokine XC receptor 1 [Galemys pyrenaicus]|uniref:Chemokine C-C motif receptor-like 2 n=1 Tax=Galemys pyrenaicus TaxID=202257 RepID=A0A8J6ALF9_GALPY|nr:Chemokine XC receptor 1 [Galemys pyrenaicus]
MRKWAHLSWDTGLNGRCPEDARTDRMSSSSSNRKQPRGTNRTSSTDESSSSSSSSSERSSSREGVSSPEAPSLKEPEGLGRLLHVQDIQSYERHSPCLMEPSSIPETTTRDVYYDYDPNSILCEHDYFNVATSTITILYTLVCFLSLLGNSLVLWILVKYESLESLTNVFILNLCLSDLLFSFTLPFLISDYYKNTVLADFICKLNSMVFSIGLYSSIFFLTIMTVHRYESIVNPLSSLRVHTLKFRVVVVAVVWTISIVSAIPDALFHKAFPDGCRYSEERWFRFSVYQHNILFLLSMAFVVFCYVEILKTLLHSRSKRRHRTVRLIFTIVVAYFLSWAPYNLILFLQTLSDLEVMRNCHIIKHLYYALIICRPIAFSHCCFNPVLYVFVGIKFRRHLKSLLRQCWFCWLQESSAPQTPYSPGAFNFEGASFY